MAKYRTDIEIMLRREFLAIAAAQTLLPQGWGGGSFGWLPNTVHTDHKTKHLYGFGERKLALLWNPWAKIHGEWQAKQQVGGDCVAVASGSCLDILTTIQILQSDGVWITESSTNAIYSGGRNNIASASVRSGMCGSWAIDYLTKYGNLLRKDYGKIDLTDYNYSTLMELDSAPLPEWLLTIAKEHPLLDHSAVDTYDEIRDAVAAGYPVIFCSKMGADNSKRDKDGFIKPKGTWYHAWTIAAVDDNRRRPGVCLLNSHGSDWGSGPKRHGQPDGSVWVDKSIINKYIYEGECYAFSKIKGFPAPEREYILW